MTTPQHRFPTPDPVTLDLRLDKGSVRIVAAEVDETTVEISCAEGPDVLRVELSGRHLVVAPVRRIRRSRIDVVVQLPTGSALRIATASADVTVDGEVASAEVNTASGRIDLGDISGRAKLRSASGAISTGSVGGELDLRSASGSLDADAVGGACTVRTASGSIQIGQADGSVSAQTASGSVSVHEVRHGTVDVTTTSGRVDLGVRRGTLVWLDLVSASGRMHSDLDSGEPATGERPDLTIRARTASGSVSVISTGATT